MLAPALIAGSLATILAGQSPPPAPACYLLTMPEVAAIVGSTTPQITTSTSSDGTSATCKYEHGGAVVNVLMLKLASAAAAKEQFETKKRAAAAHDIAAWPTAAYSATFETPDDRSAVVGVVSSLTFVEVKAIDRTRKASEINAKLQAAMKAFSRRLAAQK